MPTMFVLHVSKFDNPMNVTRVVVGCEDQANFLESKLCLLGYNVWMTEEENPERSEEECRRAGELVAEAYNSCKQDMEEEITERQGLKNMVEEGESLVYAMEQVDLDLMMEQGDETLAEKIGLILTLVDDVVNEVGIEY